MPAPRPFVACAILLAAAVTPRDGASAQSLIDYCADLYQLWMRYEWHFTLHSSQKARADIAFECDCRGGHARGVQELERLLRRGLMPIPERELAPAGSRPSIKARQADRLRS
ncbi:MAG: hypothetical protein ACOY4R_00515 [Pseudomonadota bacterium]